MNKILSRINPFLFPVLKSHAGKAGQAPRRLPTARAALSAWSGNQQADLT
ncbi:hypothetical protein [Neobacillus drentensis]